MPTNSERAERARLILEAYAIEWGDPEDHSANLTDILADLMHLAHRHAELNLDFNAQLEMAKQHFDEELLEELPAE